MAIIEIIIQIILGVLGVIYSWLGSAPGWTL